MKLTDVMKEHAENRGLRFRESEAKVVESVDNEAERILFAIKGDLIIYLVQQYDTTHPEELIKGNIPADAELTKDYMRLDNIDTGRTFFQLIWEKGHPDYLHKILTDDEPTRYSKERALQIAKLTLDLSLKSFGYRK